MISVISTETIKGWWRKTDPRLDALEAALRLRVRRPSIRAATRKATIVFDAGDAGAFTIRFRAGNVTLERGRASRATATLFGEPETLIDVLEGRLVGIDAFLRGLLFVRGNLALPMELDDLLHPTERDPRAPRCHRVKAAGVTSFYLEAGPADAPPVILIHGLGATSASFLPTIWELSRDHHVFAVDLPGFGESDKPVTPLDPAFFASWLVSFLDAVGIKRASLVGNSMGGRVSLEAALRAPERVDRIVLLAPSMAWRRYRMAAGLVRLLRPELGVLPVPVLHRLVLGVLRSLFADPGRVPTAAMNGAADEFVRIFGTPRGRIAFFNAAREIYLEHPHGDHGFWDRLPTLSRPSLFVFGDRDLLVPHRFMRHVRAAVPAATCELFRDCGHVPQFEWPERTNDLIRSFLSGHS